MSVNSHQLFYDGTPRPRWAGAVQSVAKQRATGPNRLTQSTELSGLVLPVSGTSRYSPPSGPSHSFGQSLGLPHLGELLANKSADIWKSWGHLEQALGQAAAGVMEWGGPVRPQQAYRQGAPNNALRLRASCQSQTSTAKADAGRQLRPDEISGEVSKVFAIGDVSGTQLRYESAGSSATFRATPAGVHWSKDPKTL